MRIISYLRWNHFWKTKKSIKWFRNLSDYQLIVKWFKSQGWKLIFKYFLPLNFEILEICFCIFIWCVKKRQKWFFVLSFFFFLVLIRPCNLRRMLHAIKNETRVKFDMMMYSSSASFIANFCTMLHKYRMISNNTKPKWFWSYISQIFINLWILCY